MTISSAYPHPLTSGAPLEVFEYRIASVIRSRRTTGHSTMGQYRVRRDLVEPMQISANVSITHLCVCFLFFFARRVTDLCLCFVE